MLVRAAAAAVLVVGLLLAQLPASEWETVLLALDAVPFGESDPIFRRDFSFYIFTLPVFRLAHAWLLGTVVSLGLILLAFHFLTGRLRGDPAFFGSGARKGLAVVGAAIFLLIAVGH